MSVGMPVVQRGQIYFSSIIPPNVVARVNNEGFAHPFAVRFLQ